MRPASHLVLATVSVSLLTLPHVSGGLAAGETLYVKTSGTDSANCTTAAPCLTIAHAVSVADSGDTIAVEPGTFGEGDGITIEKDLTIAGGWWLATRVTLGWLDPSRKNRAVFSIEPGVKVKLSGLTISGGGMGGIYNQGSLTLTNVWIWNNTRQGGIYNSKTASLFMTNVGIDHNSGAAGLANDGTVLVIDSHIQETRTGPPIGNGVTNTGTLIMSRGLIAGNDGAGLSQFTYTSTECTATTLLLNVTISGNHDRGIDAACGQLILRHVTIAANTAKTGAGGLQVRHTTPVVENSIVATNNGKQCGFLGGFGENSISISHSLVGDGSCILIPDSTAGNLVGVDPKLSALAYRAGEDLIAKLFQIGANRVQALLPGSPAIDSGADALCKDPIPLFGEGWLTDQFGVGRPVDGDGDGAARCDMGAYEYQPPPK
jgi:hypothetical protein